ncbi:MAG: FAD binding domain-containing protein [Dehalobacterium sp.]
MLDYKYYSPKTYEEALTLLSTSAEQMKVLGGGTDLLIRIRDEREKPEALLDISHLGLSYINPIGDKTIIGSMTSLNEVWEYGDFPEPLHILKEAAGEVGGFQTRSSGTIGGNICTGVPTADIALPLLALEANLHIESKQGSRVISLNNFFAGPRKIDLNKDEILKEVIITNTEFKEGQWGTAFIKIGKRKAMRLAVMNIAVVMNINPVDLRINKIRAAMGAAAPVPLRLYKVEEYLTGKIYSRAVVNEAKEILLAEVNPRDSFRSSREYRMDLAGVLFERALTKSANKALRGGDSNAS